MSTCLLTGAGSGIGRATAKAFHDAGWTVHATDVDADRLAELDCPTHEMDVTDGAEVGAVVDRVLGLEGGIDCLVNNAGVAQMGPVEDVPVDRVRRQFDVNVHGGIRCTQAVLPAMREAGGGTIVTVGSVQGRVSTPGWGAYTASKHALEGLTDVLRTEVAGAGVDVVLLEPAWVDTNFADAAADSLDGVARTDAYDDVYRSIEDGRLLDGGLLAVSPVRVGERIREVAETEDPKPGYTVGLPARLVLLTRLLPDRLQDATQRLAIRWFGR